MTLLKIGSLRVLTALTLTLAAPACGTEGETSDASTGSSTTAVGSTGDLTGESTSAVDTSTSATHPTTGATTTDATTTADSTGGDLTTTGDATTDDSTTGVVADCGFDPGVTFTRDALVYQLESDDGATCVWLERRNDSEPDVIYKAVPYSLLEWKSGHAGVVLHVTDATLLTWESTHHNWSDVATATDTGVRYRLEDWYALDEFSDSFRLYAYDAGTDALLWGPIALHPYTP